jgi:hypothetical protein
LALVPAPVASGLSRAVGLSAPAAALSAPASALRPVGALAMVLLALVVGVVGVGHLARARSDRRRAATWSCGHPAVVPTMQYTATSFSEPITATLQPLLATQVTRTFGPDRTHPRVERWTSDTPDRLLESGYLRLSGWLYRAGERVRELHQPRVSRSLLYIVLTVLLLLGLLFMPVAQR